MSVIACKLKHGSRRGPVLRKGQKYEYHETWVVTTDSAADDGRIVRTDTRLPQYGTAYDDDAGATVTSIEPRQRSGSDIVWDVAITYTELRGTVQSPPLTVETISTRLAMKNWTSVPYRVYRTEDLAGKDYQNSAGDPFDPPPPQFRINRVLTINHAYLNHSEVVAEQYLNSINTDALAVDGKSYPPFAAKFNRWDAQLQYLDDENATPYYNYTVEIEFMGDGELWFPWIEVDRGPRHKVVGKEGLFLPKDDDGVTYQSMVLLDGNGFPARKSATFTQTADIEFDIYKKLPFRPLNLPFFNSVDVWPI